MHVFIDCESTGLNPDLHEVWEIAYAVDDGPILSSFVQHSPPRLDSTTIPAFRINGYLDRYQHDADQVTLGNWRDFEGHLQIALSGRTLVASNPSFDTAFLRKRWGVEPWHHRKIDISTFALPVYGEMLGLYKLAERLKIDPPDHTAAQDVATLRQCFRALQAKYAAVTW